MIQEQFVTFKYSIVFSCSDLWFSSAIACLQSHPEGSVIVANFLNSTNSQSQSSIHARKLLLFQTLTNHYAGRKHPLIPTKLHEILLAVLDSLARGKTSRAIELTQLVLMIQEIKDRDELQKLLHFMSMASTKNAVKLSYEVHLKMEFFILWGIALDFLSESREYTRLLQEKIYHVQWLIWTNNNPTIFCDTDLIRTSFFFNYMTVVKYRYWNNKTVPLIT